MSRINDNVFDFGGNIVFKGLFHFKVFPLMPWGIGKKKRKKKYATNDPNFYNNDVLFNPINQVNPDSNPVAAAHIISIKDWRRSPMLS